MNREEFLSNVPTLIVDKTLGQGIIKTHSWRDQEYLAWYEYGSHVSPMSLGSSWQEVYDRITQYLKNQGIYPPNFVSTWQQAVPAKSEVSVVRGYQKLIKRWADQLASFV
jgi:hypothetical protein